MSFGIEQIPLVKIFLTTGALAAAFAAIYRVIKWFQGPAADNKIKLEALYLEVSDMKTQMAVMDGKIAHITENVSEQRDDLKGIRSEVAGIHLLISRALGAHKLDGVQ